jgi:hypothetical protein
MKIFIFLFSLLAAIFFSFSFYYYLKRNKPLIKNSDKKSLVIIASLFLAAICSWLMAISLCVTNNLILNASRITTDYSKVGAYGDLIGGIMNPIVGFIAIIAASLAFYAQYEANKQIQDQFKIQQFESQFFEMLRLHRANIDEIKIVGYEMITSTSILKGTNGASDITTITVSRQPRTTEGRKVFVTMVTELVACIELLRLYNINWGLNINEHSLFKLAYEFFFFGSKSEVVSSNVIDSNVIDNFRIELNKISDFHKNSAGEKNRFHGVNGAPIKLYIKYQPFSGHENRLGHYYRHLYSTVKYVVNKEKEGLIDYKQTREYLKILRSQMSNDEQLMLYYNYIIGFGKDWENEGYLTKYRMLHNLPINKVNYAENPRLHFREFINSIKSGEGDLFEWGDIEV